MKTIRRLAKTTMGKWIMSSEHLPATRDDLSPPSWQPERESGSAPQNLPYEGLSLDDLTRIVLTDLIDCPLQHLKIIEQVGRVVLVAYQPYNHYDPVIPVPLVNLGGSFKNNYKKAALELSAWVSDMFALVQKTESYNNINISRPRTINISRPRTINAAHYFSAMRPAADRAVRIAQESGLLTPEEDRYFSQQMILSVVKPDRFTQYDNDKWQAIWQRAVSINNYLSSSR